MFWIVPAITLLTLLVASLYDIRTREVPDWLSYALISFGIGSALLASLLFSAWTYFLMSILGFICTLILSCLLYYSGQWGGGDAKLLMGMGSIIGLWLPLAFVSPLLIYTVLLFVGGAVYGLIWSSILGITHYPELRSHFLHDVQDKLLVGISIFIGFFLICVSFLYLGPPVNVLLMLVGGVVGMLPVIFFFLRAVEATCFVKKIQVSQLTEGDWIKIPVTLKGKTIYEPEKTGITLRQLEKLKKHPELEVTIKTGIPFVPSFLLAYILLWIVTAYGTTVFGL